MQTILKKFSFLFSIGSMLILFLSSCQADIRTDYVVELVDFSSKRDPLPNGFKHKVVAFDSRSDSIQIIPRDIEKDVYSIFCELADDTLLRDSLGNKRDYPISSNSAIRELVGKNLPDSGILVQYHGPCHSGSGFRSTRVTGFRVHRGPKAKKTIERFFEFYCLYNMETNEVILVDSIIYPQDYVGRVQFNKGQFNSEGTHFYYSKDGISKRYQIDTGEIEDLPQGSHPIIPWNQEAVVVYSEEEELFKLLANDGTVKSTVKRKIWPRNVQSVFAIDSTTLVVASSAPPKEWYPPNEEVYVIDFATGKSQLLIDRISVRQILDAKRVE